MKRMAIIVILLLTFSMYGCVEESTNEKQEAIDAIQQATNIIVDIAENVAEKVN